MMLAPDDAALDTLGGVPVLSLMAADAEYGAALSQRLRPVRIGVGPIEAAINTVRALTALQRRGTLPALVLSLGSAGSNTLEQTSVHAIASVSWRDMDASPLGFEKGCTPFLDLPAERSLPNLWAGSKGSGEPGTVRLSTGANVIGDAAAYARIDADMVDMETFAVLRACDAFELPLAGIRAVSDGDATLARYGDWADCLPQLDAGLAQAVDRLAAALADGTLGMLGRA